MLTKSSASVFLLLFLALTARSNETLSEFNTLNETQDHPVDR